MDDNLVTSALAPIFLFRSRIYLGVSLFIFLFIFSLFFFI